MGSKRHPMPITGAIARGLATPEGAARRRRRRDGSPEGDGDSDVELKGILDELGIESSAKKQRPVSRPPADGEVIELLSPPSAKRPAARSADASVVDLTTPDSEGRHPPTVASVGMPAVRTNLRFQFDDVFSDSDHADAAVESDHEEIDSLRARLASRSAVTKTVAARPMTVENDAAEQGVNAVDDDEDDDDAGFMDAYSYSPSASPEVIVMDSPCSASPKRTDDAAIGPKSPTLPSTPPRRAERRPTAQTVASTAPQATAASEQPQLEQRRTSVRASRPKKTSTPRDVVAVTLALEESMDATDLGSTIKQAVATSVYNNKTVPTRLIPAFSSMTTNVIELARIRTSHTVVECTTEMTTRVEERIMVLVHEAETFLDMVIRKGYREVETMTKQLVSARSRPKSRVAIPTKTFLVLQGMDQALVQRKRKGNKRPRTEAAALLTFQDINELSFQLYMDTGTHTKFTCDVQATADYIALLARELHVAASKPSTEEEFLESVPRLSSFRVTHAGATMNNHANAWVRMLQMIPGVSEDKAQSILDHFPTFASLQRMYNDPSLSTACKENALADKLHGSKIERALSKRIFNVFALQDPDALI